MKNCFLFIALLAIVGCCELDIRRVLTDLEYTGVIEAKFIDYSDKASRKFRFENGSIQTTYNWNIYDLAEIGDKVIKRKGSLKHILIKRDTTIVYYPVCGKHTEVKDE